MDNQKPTEGKGISATNAGSSIGKSQDNGLNKNTTASGSQQSASSSSNLGASSQGAGAMGTSASSSSNLGASSQGTGALGTSSVGSSQSATTGNSGLGNSGSSASTGAGSASGSSSTDTSSSTSSTDKESTVGGIKAAISSISPDKVHAGIDKAAQAAQPVVDSLASKAHAGVDKVTGLLGSAQEKFGDRSSQLSEKCSDMSAQGKEYVKTNPASALLAAVGVGFILAKLLGGSSDRNEYRNYRDYRD